MDIEWPPENANYRNVTKCVRLNFKGLAFQQRLEEDDFIKNAKWFKKMVHLKLLKVDNVKFQGDFRHMPCELRWLRWRGCPHKSLPNNIPEEIRVLDLSGSNIEHLWSSDCLYWVFNKVNLTMI